jgi:hypothetical protein
VVGVMQIIKSRAHKRWKVRKSRMHPLGRPLTPLMEGVLGRPLMEGLLLPLMEGDRQHDH